MYSHPEALEIKASVCTLGMEEHPSLHPSSVPKSDILRWHSTLRILVPCYLWQHTGWAQVGSQAKSTPELTAHSRGSDPSLRCFSREPTHRQNGMPEARSSTRK